MRVMFFRLGLWFALALQLAAQTAPVGTPLWSFRSPIVVNLALGPDATLYAAGRDGLIALDSQGNRKWRVLTNEIPFGGPSVAPDGTIYQPTGDVALVAVNPDGTVKWRFATTTDSFSGTPAIGPDGTVYVGSVNFYAIHPDGTQKWKVAIGPVIHGSAVVGADGTIYFGSEDKHVYALNPADGGVKWSYPVGDTVEGTPGLGADGTLYIGSNDHWLYALNPDGTRKWRFGTGGGISASPTVAADGTIYVGSDDGKLYAVHPDGTSAWSFNTHGSINTAASVLADGTVVVANSNTQFYGLAPNGIQRWTFDPGSFVYSQPVVGLDGVIYLILPGFPKVAAFAGAAPLAQSPWPTFMRDAGHQGRFSDDVPAAPQIVVPPLAQAVTNGASLVLRVQATGVPTPTWQWRKDGQAISGATNAAYFRASAGAGDTGGYDVVVANASGSVTSAPVAVRIIDPPHITVPPLAQVILPGDTATLTVAAAGSPPLGYQWLFNGNALGGAISNVLTVTNFQAANEGPYAVAITNADGAITSAPVKLTLLVPGVAEWRFPTPYGVSAIPAVATDGTLYFGGGGVDPTFYALTSGGQLKWTNSLSSYVAGSPAVGADGTVYFVQADGHVLALAPDGTQRWEYTVAGNVFVSPAIGPDGTVYVGSGTGALYALNPAGTLRWSSTVAPGLGASPAIGSDQTVYLGGVDGMFYALKPDGTKKWSFNVGPSISSSPALGADGTIYFGADDKKIHALNPDGSPKWAFTTAGYLERASPAIGPDGVIYCGSDDGKLYAFSPAGVKLWAYATGGGIFRLAPAISADGTIYVAGFKGLYALNPTGSLRWLYSAGGQAFGGPQLLPGGTVLFGANDATLTAIHGTTGLAASAWPMFHRDGQLTGHGLGQPDVAITQPADGDHFVTGDTVAIMVTAASANGSIAQLRLLSGTNLLAAFAAPPFSYALAVTNAGTQVLTAVATDSVGAFKTSAPVTITVTAPNTPPSIVQQPQGLTTTNGGSVTLVVGPAGSLPLHIQWLKDGVNVPGATQATLTLTNLSLADSAMYVAVVTNVAGTVTSAPAVVSVLQPVSALWNQQLGLMVEPPAVAPDGTAYAAGFGTLAAVNRDGSHRWEYRAAPDSFGSTVASGPVVTPGGDILFGAYSGFLYALNPAGEKRWEFPLNDAIDASAAIGADGAVYFGRDGGEFYALNPDGSVRWHLTAGGAIASSPAIGGDGTVYFGAGTNLLAVGANGVLHWRFPTGDAVKSSPAIAADGTVLVGSMDGKVYAVTPAGGLRWSFASGGPVYSSPAIGTDGTVYVGTVGAKIPNSAKTAGRLLALTPDGVRKWEFPVSNGVHSSPAAAADGTVYFGTDDGVFFALNANGTEKWEYLVSGAVQGAVTIDPAGRVYFGSLGNAFVAIDDGSGPARSSWPMFRREYRHRGRAGAGAPPRLAITAPAPAPADGSPFVVSSDLDLTATVTETDEPVEQVDLLVDGVAIGSTRWSPYTVRWTNPPPGIHLVSARATDRLGVTTDSAAVSVSVVPPPIVTISSPVADGQYQGGDSIALRVTLATNAPAIAHVDYYLGGILLQSVTNSPFAGLWAPVPPGNYLLTAHAFDLQSHEFISPTVTVSVAARPLVQLVSPPDGSVFTPGSVVPLVADVSGATNPVTRVDFYAGTTLIGTVTNSPYQWNWTNGVNGPFPLVAAAVDSLGHTNRSAPRTVWFFDYGTQTIDFGSFPSAAGLRLQGTAQVAGNRVALTGAGTADVGAAWIGIPLYVAGGFECDFEIQITNRQAGGGAGFALVIQGNPAPVLGQGGAGLGYQGIPRSLAIEFDSHQDGFEQDPSGSHVGIHSRKLDPNSADEAYSYVTTGAGDTYDFTDGKPHRVHVKYTPGERDGNNYMQGTLTVIREPYTSPTVALSTDLDTALGLVNGQAWIGFTAANGPGTETHDLRQWKFRAPSAPPIITSQPHSQTLVAGSTATLSVTANGLAPLAYQWRLNGTNLPAATGPTLQLANVQAADAGDYDVFVSNPSGGILSQPAHISVTLAGTVRWQYQGDGAVSCPPALDTDGTLYFGTTGGGANPSRLVALDASGNRKWQLPLATVPHTAPAIGNGHVVYLGSDDHNLYAISAAGSVLWTFPTTDAVSTTPAIGADGTLYFGTADGRLYALFPDGTKKWDVLVGSGQFIASAPVIGSDNTIYFGSLDHRLHALNPDGTAKWSFNTGGEIHASPAIGGDGTLYFPSYDGNLYAVRPDGTQKWASPDGGSDFTPVIAADGTLYLSRGRTVKAFNAVGGALWTFETADTVPASPSLAADGIVYLGSMDGHLFALNPDGSQNWAVNAGSGIYAAGTIIGPDGTVYAGTVDGRLIAYRGGAPLAASPWPLFHRDAARSGTVPPAGPPVFTFQPAGRTLGAGTNLTLSVMAVGAPALSYQWLRDGVPLADGGNVSGSATATLSLAGITLEQAGNYTAKVSNPLGTNVTRAALIIVLPFYQTPGTIQWSYQAGGSILTTPAAAPDGTLCFATDEQDLYAVGADGHFKWRFHVGSPVSPAAVGTDGTVYFTAQQPTNLLVALNPGGTVRWSVPLSFNTQSTPALGLDGRIYVVTGDGLLRALNPDGSGIWSVPLGDRFDESTPSIGEDGIIYVGAGHFDTALGYTVGDCLALYPDGTVAWKFSARGPFPAAPAIGQNGDVYFASADNGGTIYHFDRFGRLKWQYASKASHFFGPVVAADGTLFAADGQVLKPDGSKKWKGVANASGALAADGSSYYAGSDGMLRAYDPDGKLLWDTNVNGFGGAIAPLLSPDGIVYATRGNVLAAVQASAGLAPGGWPMTMLNPAHTANRQTQALPIVIISAPADGAHFRDGSDVTIQSRTPVTAGGITGVGYLIDGNLVGHALAGPYEYVWPNAGPGVHRLTAVVTNVAGITRASQEVTVVINNPPAVALTQPADHSVFQAEDDIPLVATVADADGSVARVDFYQGLQLLGSATQAPFAWTWNRVPAGGYALRAVATDNLGDTNVSAPLFLTVNAPPLVTLSSPANNASIPSGQAITLTAQASDADGQVVRVDFYDDSQLLGSAASAPYQLKLSAPPVGRHVFYARAYDNHGGVAFSAVASVTVVTANQAPVLSFLSPFDHAFLNPSKPVPVAVRATDAEGTVTNLQILLNGTVVASSPAAGTLQWSWTNPVPGSAQLTARAVDNLGATRERSLAVTVLAADALLPAATVPTNAPRPELWVPDGVVNTLLHRDGILYVGGSFSHIGQYVPGNSLIEVSAGTPDLSYPGVDILVDTIIDDGAGGFYVGGYFNTIGGVSRRNLAHVNADKTVDLNFRADTDGHVLCLTLAGGVLYAGGEFDTVDGQDQRYLAALDPRTGALLDWKPAPTDWVSGIAVAGGVAYLGGNFQYVGGEYRSYVAAVSLATGLATPWNPGADNWLGQLLVANGRLFAAGHFGRIGGQVRNGLAAFDLTTGNLDAFNSGGLAGAQCLASDQGVLYVGGGFGVIGFDLASGAAVLNAGVSGTVNGIAVLGDTVYVDGDFSQINGVARNRVAAINRFSGAVSGLDLNPSGRFVVLGRSGNRVIAAGSLGLIQVSRPGLAAIDEATGFATAWNPRCDGTVYALAAAGDTLYVGGQYQTLGGQSRASLGAVSLGSGAVTGWHPSAANVRALALAESTVFVGGYFNQIGSQTRNHAAELDLRTGDPTPWNPNVNGAVRSLQLVKDTLYLGGEFTQVGGQGRGYLAAVDRYSGVPTAWSPTMDGYVVSLASGHGFVYAGGGFMHVGGQAHTYLAALDAETGAAADWFPQADGGVLALQCTTNLLYVGGQFTHVGTAARINLAAVDLRPYPPAVLDWNPQPGSEDSAALVGALAVTDSSLFAGGRYKTVAGVPGPYLSGFDFPAHVTPPLVLPGGIFTFNFYGPLGYYYVFEASTNLQDWSPIFTNKAPFIFNEVEELGTARRYFRARPLP